LRLGRGGHSLLLLLGSSLISLALSNFHSIPVGLILDLALFCRVFGNDANQVERNRSWKLKVVSKSPELNQFDLLVRFGFAMACFVNGKALLLGKTLELLQDITLDSSSRTRR
jgi:hypothetical protein